MKRIVLVLFMFIGLFAGAQVRFSIAPDISLMRNFSPKQKFWAVGETVQANFHFAKKETVYAWITFYTPGKFRNHFLATAKSQTTTPASIPFTASASWRNNQLSMGWKHYFRGSFDNISGYNIYGTGGFGLMFTKVTNTFNPVVDTALYATPTLPGSSEFYRLTIDLGAGVEFPLGVNFFIYGDARTWIPTSDYPSPYLHNTKNVPLPFMIGGGLRVLFGY